MKTSYLAALFAFYCFNGYGQTQTQDLNMGLYQLQFPSTSGGNNRIQSFGGSSVYGTWLFKSRFDHITFDAGENSSNKRKIIFKVGGVDKALINADGNVGIGTITPSNLLEIKSSLASTNPALESENDQGTSSYFYTGRSGNSGLVNKTIIENASGNDILLNPTSGNIGIGTSSPGERVHVNGNSIFDGKFGASSGLSDGSQRGFYVWRIGDPNHVIYSSASTGLSPGGNDAADGLWDTGHRFRIRTATGQGFLFENQNETALLDIDADNGNLRSIGISYFGGVGNNYFAGNVGIGTTTPSEKLEVNGTIRTKEVKVESTPWPDYVFSDTYQLKSLSEVSTYIQENHHLPSIPTAEEVAENGIKLGEMNAKLLEKIEELTLYLIEKDREIKDLKERIEKVEIGNK